MYQAGQKGRWEKPNGIIQFQVVRCEVKVVGRGGR